MSVSAYAVGQQLERLQRRARKSLGQNFLVNETVARRIVATAGLDGTQTVVEIGPGLGALSLLLRPVARRLFLVELDRDLAANLRDVFAQDDGVEILEADALDVDFATLDLPPPARVVANLPYNVATPVIAKLLACGRFDRLVVMVQLEVAKRMQARAGDDDYGALSVFTQAAARPSIAFRVGPGNFKPRPKIDSAVVCLEPHAAPRVPAELTGTFERLVRASFQQRRKQLQNSIRPLTSTPEEALAAAGIDPRRRPESLSLDEFVRLAGVIAKAGAPDA